MKEKFMFFPSSCSLAHFSVPNDILFSVAYLSRAVMSVCISIFKLLAKLKSSLDFRASGNL